MSDKKKHISANKYLQYLKGELSNQERHSFERKLEADSFEQEALEGFETITTDQAEEDMLTMHNRLRKRLSKRRRVAFYSIAATVASFLIVGTVFLQIHDFNPKGKEKQLVPEGSFSTSPSKPNQDQQGIESEQETVQEVVVEPEATEVIEMDEELEVSEEIEILEFIAEPEMQAKIEEPEMQAEMAEPEMQAERAAPALAPVSEDKKADQITHMEAQPEPESTSKKRASRRKETQAQPVADQAQEELAYQLSGKVSGVVISAEDQEPIPGASIVIRGLNTRTVTDSDGRFDLPVEEESNTTLVASYIGMETQEYPVTEGSDVELVMQPDAVTLDEVVVIGYAVERETVPTGSVSQVNTYDKQEGTDYTGAKPSIGFREFKTYIEENIQFPLQNSDIQKAVVVLKFKVSSTGEIIEIITLRSPGESFSEEAISLLKEGPSWDPAKNKTGTMEDWVRLRIVFKK